MSGPQKAIDAVFAKHGVDLTIDPDGAGEPTVRALVRGASNDQQFTGRSIRSDAGGFAVRIADLPHMSQGVVFGEGDKRHEVKGEPFYPDRFRLVAELETVER